MSSSAVILHLKAMSDFVTGDLPSQDAPLMTFEAACVGWDTYEPEQGVESYWMEGDSLAPPCQSDLEVVHGVLEFANISKDSVLYDLGCGDGRICVLASKMYGCKSCGAEIEERLLKKFQGNIDREKLNDSVAVYAGDLRTMNFTPATHLIIYLLPEAIDQITPMLVDAINNGCTVICIGWQAKAFTPSAHVKVGTYLVDLYKYDMNSIPNVASLMERKGSVPMDMEAMENLDESEQMW